MANRKTMVLVSALLIGACATGLAGCAAQPKKQSLTATAKLRMSEEELRERVDELARLFVGEYETVLNQVIAETQDPLLRERALLAKIRINTEVVSSTSHLDPVVSLLDLWSLAAQLRLYAGEDQIAAWYQDYTPWMLESASEVEAACEELGAMAAANEEAFAETRRLVHEYAEEHPMTGRLYRPSPSPLFAEYRQRTSGGLFGNVESLDEGVTNIATRLDTMMDQLPKQIVWRADLLVQERLNQLHRAGVFDQLDRTVALAESLPQDIDRQRVETLEEIDVQRVDTLDRIDALADRSLENIDAQRAESLALVEDLHARTIEEIDAQRTDTIDRVDASLARVLEDVDRQRGETLEAVDASLENVLREVRETRTQVGDDLEAARAAIIAEGQGVAEAVVDRLFVRVLILMAVAGIGGAVLVVLVHRVEFRA